jgi:Fe-S cluster assembly protein SufD
MSRSLDSANRYVDLFNQIENKYVQSSEDLTYRRDALQKLSRIGFPSSSDEEWRDTKLSSFLSKNFVSSASCTSTKDLSGLVEMGLESSRIVFVDGHLQKNLTSIDALSHGLSIKSKMPISSTVFRNSNNLSTDNDDAFKLLNSAFAIDTTYIEIASEKRIEKPIELVFVAFVDQVSSHPRINISLGRNSCATVVERYVSFTRESHFTNAQINVHIEEGGKLDHCRIQDENDQAYHFSSFTVKQESESVFRSTCISLGGLLTRNSVHTILDGKQIESTLNGLYAIDEIQHVDNHTLVEHKQANSNSYELYKGILFDESSGVFRGQVLVQKEAQKTDAYQQNQNLLLSEDAKINTKPQLEIYADDVKCSHGATIGELDRDAIFYLRSRGISRNTAYHILTLAFSGQIIDEIANKQLREFLHKRVSSFLISKFTEQNVF